MDFQNYVYTIVKKDTNICLGTYPNFKKAYERIEEFAKGNVIVDCGGQFDNEVHFQVIKTNKGHVYGTEYVVYRNLLTIYNSDQLITTKMIEKMTQACEENDQKSKYVCAMGVL